MLAQPDHARSMVLNIEDVNERKLAEAQAVQAMAQDWLTGLLNVTAFRALCLRRGFSDGGGKATLVGVEPHLNAAVSAECDFLADFFEGDSAYKKPSEEYGFRSIVAIAFDSTPATQEGISFLMYQDAVRKAASTLRLAAIDGDLIARVDSSLFFIAPMSRLSRSEYIDKARILLSSMMIPLEGETGVSARAGIVLCEVGETYENAVALALRSLEESFKEPEPCIVFRSTENLETALVQPVFGSESYVVHASGYPASALDDDTATDAANQLDAEEAVENEEAGPSSALSEKAAHSPSYLASLTQSVVSDDCAAQVRTFGYFDVFVNGRAVVFRSPKAKELLALLVDHHGGYVTPAFAISCLWESEPDNKASRARYRKVALTLRRVLEENGLSDIMEEYNGSRRIVPERVDCDLFNYQVGLRTGKNEFRGVYLPDYSWGELTLAQLAHEAMMKE